jgi:hypothetical protein
VEGGVEHVVHVLGQDDLQALADLRRHLQVRIT